MSASVAGVSTKSAPVTALENSPSSSSWVSVFGRTGGAAPTFSASSRNIGAHWLEAVPTIW